MSAKEVTAAGTPLVPVAGMNDLPVELILKVIELDEYKNLWILGQLSRYINSVAMSCYFNQGPDRHHLDSLILHFDGKRTTIPSECTALNAKIIPTQPPADILTILSTAFNIQTLGKFVWVFTGLPSARSTNRPSPDVELSKHYRRLTMFLGRLTRIDQIYMDFKGDICPRSSSEESLRLRLDDWTMAMTDLLNVCMEKFQMNPKGAEGFTMEGGLPMVQSGYEVHRGWGLRARVVGWFTTDMVRRNPTLDGSNWNIVRFPGYPLSDVDRNTILSPGARSVAVSTQKFRISFSVLLHPPLCEWTYQFISAAPLTSLILENLFYSLDWWDIMFPWLSPILQRLEDLTIRNCDFIRPPPLAKLLQNLPQLKHCHIDILLYTKPRYLISCNLPPNLTTFVAPSDFIHLIRPKGFQVREQRLKKPSPLKTLRVVISCRDDSEYPPSTCRTHVKDILQAYPDVPWIVLDIQGVPRGYDSRVFLHLEPRAWELGIGKKGSAVVTRLVKELVVSEEKMRCVVKGEREKADLLNLLGVFNGLEVVSVAAPTTVTSALNGTEWMRGHKWIDPRLFGLMKSACGSLEMIQLEGAERNIVIHDFR